MRRFTDDQNREWVATVAAEEGGDYKGRYYLVLHRADDADSEGHGVALDDVRWNSPRTAERTMRTMSPVELRRRLRSAEGRAGRAPAMGSAAT